MTRPHNDYRTWPQVARDEAERAERAEAERDDAVMQREATDLVLAQVRRDAKRARARAEAALREIAEAYSLWHAKAKARAALSDAGGRDAFPTRTLTDEQTRQWKWDAGANDG